jgi:hypothetical protein
VVDVPEARCAVPRRCGRPGTGPRTARVVRPAAPVPSPAPDRSPAASARSPDVVTPRIAHADGRCCTEMRRSACAGFPRPAGRPRP